MKCFICFAMILVMIPAISLKGQQVVVEPALKRSLPLNSKSAICVALDSLMAQISRNQVEEYLLNPSQVKLTKSLLEDVNYYEKKIRDSINSIQTKLLNFYPIGPDAYLGLIGHYGVRKDQSTLEILFNLIIHVQGQKVEFSSPLSYNTKAWKQQRVGQITYHYRDSIKLHRAQKFAQNNVLFASRFKKEPAELKFYMANNYQEVLNLLGIQFCRASIGRLRDGYGVLANEYIFSVMNNEDFSHDLFHYYSGSVHEQSVRNWVTEEGIAYSWGNAYYTKIDGEMGEQEELLTVLRDYLDHNSQTDLLELFENNFWTDKSDIFDQLAPDFSVGRLISSLICDEVMRIHGMDGINELITCGSEPNRFDPFFETTNRLIKLNRANFNEKIKNLIVLRD